MRCLAMLIVLVLLPTGTTFAQPCSPTPSGIISWWPAEGNANDVVDGNHGTFVNGATTTSGKVGQAFDMGAASGYVSVLDAPSLHPQSLTLEGWFNFAGTHKMVLVGKTVGTGTYESFVIFLESAPAELQAAVGDATGLGSVLRHPFVPTLGSWYHVAYTFDDVADEQVLYVDGVAVTSGAVTKSMGFDSHALTIGAEYENDVLFYYFAGLIDEVAIYDRALSAAEVQGIVNAGGAGKCPGGLATQSNSWGGLKGLYR